LCMRTAMKRTFEGAKFQLTYFNGRGRAEKSRMLFNLAGQEFDDVRVSSDFQTKKEQGLFTPNMDRLPVLNVTAESGTLTIGQSKTIERYLAKKFGFFGNTVEDEARIDMICEHITDIAQKYNDSKIGKVGDEANAAKTQFIVEELPKWFAKLEKVIDSNQFAVGEQLSLADVTIFFFIRDYCDDKASMNAVTSSFEKLVGVCDNVGDRLKVYLETRPVTAF